MKDSLEEADREIRRVDHLIYVSLKYTRTVDILKSAVQRIIDAYDAAILALLKFLKEGGRIDEIPKSPGLRVTNLKGCFTEEPLFLDFFEHYLQMREILRSDFDRREEFRRHVTMISKLKGKMVEITIDSITEDYKKVKTFVMLVRTYIEKEGRGDISEMLRKVDLDLEYDQKHY